MPAQNNPWIRCSPSDRRIIESLQGDTQPIDADEIVRVLGERYRQGGSQVAVFDGDRTWTYAELGQRVFELASRLSEEFSLPESTDRRIFGVSIDRSAHLIAAVHAVALTGSSYCPINPSDPTAWKQAMMRTSDATSVLLTEEDGEEHRAAFDNYFLVHGEHSGHTDFEPAKVSDDDILQIIFTSGSTGRPKGVMCTHNGFANRIRWMQDRFPLSDSDRVALKTPITFDVAGWEMFWPQYAGAQTVVVPPGAHTSPEALISLFNEYSVTVAHFVPSMLRLWLRAGGARRCPTLRLVFSSGEALEADLVEEFTRQSNAELHNLYGPTEAAIDVTHFRADDIPRNPVPIGLPITNTHIYVLDPDQAICPIGEVGEIYIHGVGVAAGYLGAEAKDNERFSFLSLMGVEGWRTFRTGDAGRYTDDGQIQYCGRLDSQVKIRGQRVELAEVTAAVRNHEAVLDAHAKAYISSGGRTQLAAYAVIDPEQALADPVGELTVYLESHLPERSRPARIIVTESLPLSRHGKVDESKLPLPGRSRPDIKTPFQEPSGPLEEMIASIWARVLDLDEVGVHDNFHDLGGDSLAAVEISFILTERLGLEYDDPLIPEILISGDTVANSASITAKAEGR